MRRKEPARNDEMLSARFRVRAIARPRNDERWISLRKLTPLRGRRKLLGSVAFGHVDDRLHRRGEFVDIAHIGKIPLRYPPERPRRDAIEQDDAEIAVRAAGSLTGVEFFPAKMERGVGIFPGHFPMRDNVWVLADQRQPLVGMRRQFEKQQRET